MATQLQHQEPLIIQRINGYFGYGAIARLAITQGPVALRPTRKPPAAPELTPQQERQLTERLTGIDDPELKNVLAALGRHLAVKG